MTIESGSQDGQFVTFQITGVAVFLEITQLKIQPVGAGVTLWNAIVGADFGAYRRNTAIT